MKTKIVELTPPQIKTLRDMAKKSQDAAANDLHKKDGAFWRKYESDGKSARSMPSYYVELFCLKNNIKYPPF